MQTVPTLLANMLAEIGQHVGTVCHTITTYEMFWVADITYKWSFAKMAENKAVFCLLLALLVEDEEEKTRGKTQPASLNEFLIKGSPKLMTEIENVAPKCCRDIANRTNTSILFKSIKCFPTFSNMFKTVGQHFLSTKFFLLGQHL